MSTKISSSNIQAGTLLNIVGPRVTGITYPGDDTATNPAGGATITLTGTGFTAGTSVLVNGTIPATSVSVISVTSITFVAPAMSVGTYILYLINSDGGTAVSIPGISYSGVPAWSTTAGSLGSATSSSSVSITLAATGDAPITYSVASGTLPSGITLNSSTGLLSGTAPVETAATTYTFTINATDPQNQDTSRSFSLTVAPGIAATGGTVTIVNGYKIHTFTSTGSGSFVVSNAPVGATAEYLIVGGGAGGNSGGGGAGGVLYGTLPTTTGTYAINIGAGSLNGYDSNGTNSTLTHSGTTYTAYGGGKGTGYGSPPAQGGSGGSGGGTGNHNSSGGSVAGGVKSQTTQGALTGYGNNGGAGGNVGNNPPYPAGGGGGAGAVGNPALSNGGGAGGAGIVNPIVGSTIGQWSNGQYYIAGGGGGSADSNGGLGGLGGGGRGADQSYLTSSNFTAQNTGAGGGGYSRYGGNGGAANGVVIIRYPV